MGSDEVPVMATPMNSTATESYRLMLHIVLSIQVTLAAIGFLVNTILLIGQIRASNWPFFQRLLFTNVTTAAAISCLVHCVQGSVQIHQLSSGGDGALEGALGWSDQAADTAQTTVAINMATLAFQNYFALRQCDKQINCATMKVTSKKVKVLLICLMIIGVWLIAAGFVAGDLNPQAQIYKGEEKSNASTYISFGVGMSIEFSVICTIYATRRMLRQLQTDFEVHRAQQSLNVRVHIKETINLTSAISRVLISHMFVWVTTIVTCLGVNRCLESNGNGEKIESQISAFTAVVDCMVMTFDVVYPFVVMWKQPQLQRRMGLAEYFHSLGRGPVIEQAPSPKEITVLPPPEVKYAQRPPPPIGHAHFYVVSNVWDRVAMVKYSKSPPSIPSIRVTLADPFPNKNTKLEMTHITAVG